MLNRTLLLEELAAHQIAEVPPTPDSTGGDRPPIGPARRGKIEKKIEGETIETLRDFNSESQAKIDVLTTERHTFVKENDKLRIVCQTAVDENVKMKSGNQALLEESKCLISMNLKLTAGQRTCQNVMCSWQSDADKLQSKIDCTASENERLYSVNQQLMEANEVLAADQQKYKLYRNGGFGPGTVGSLC
jgi:hypothetical protein